MSGELERYRPPAVERLERKTVDAIASTALVPEAIRGNVPAIIATILKGRALGLDDMHALTALHWINGKPVTGTETMVACVRRQGHSIAATYGDGEVTAKGKRADNGDEATVTWTTAMAQRAGLLGKDNWKKYPEAMLWARAAAQLCRVLFPDVLAGVSYTPEELELSPEEQVAADIGALSPPADHDGPDDTGLSGEGGVNESSPARRSADVTSAGTAAAADPPASTSPPAESPADIDEPDWVEGHPVLVDETEGEPQAAAHESGTVSPAGAAPEPGSPSGQGSIFSTMAEQAQTRKRRRGVAD